MWLIATGLESDDAGLYIKGNDYCPTDSDSGWNYYDGKSWSSNKEIEVRVFFVSIFF